MRMSSPDIAASDPDADNSRVEATVGAFLAPAQSAQDGAQRAAEASRIIHEALDGSGDS